MADLGLLAGGIGTGLSSFVNTMQDQDKIRAQQQALQMQQQQMQSGLLSKGQQVNPDTGQVGFNQLGQTNQDVAQKQADYQKSVRTAGTPESDQVIKGYKEAWNQLNPGKGDKLVEGMTSGADILDNPDHMKSLQAMALLHHQDKQFELQNKKMEMTMGNQQARLDQGRERLNNTTLQAASHSYDKNMGQTETQILAAKKLNDVLEQAKNGTLVPSQVLNSEISGSLASMFTGKPATVTGMTEAEYKSMPDLANKFVGFLSGDPQKALTPGELDQLMKETKALQGEYLNQHKDRFNSFIKRQPETIRDQLTQSYNEFRSPYEQQHAAQGAPSAPQGNAPTQDIQSAAQAELARRKAAKGK